MYRYLAEALRVSLREQACSAYRNPQWSYSDYTQRISKVEHEALHPDFRLDHGPTLCC